MRYFKNTELAKLHGISEKTVRNWIQASTRGDLELQLHQEREHLHIANTAQNNFLIEELVKKGKKFRNTRGRKTITPIDDFYRHYSTKEIYDIISNIDTHREIPHKYSYYSTGAHAWDDYVVKQVSDPFPGALTHTQDLLDLSIEYIDTLLENYTGVNIIDLGVGNAYPVQNLLKHFIEKKMLHRYVALDASKDMVNIAEKNVRKWFGHDIIFDKHIMDMNFDKFGDLLVPDSFTEKNQSILNVVLFLGGTIANLRDPDLALKMIYNSMSKDDLFIISRKLDTSTARRFFDFVVATKKGKLVAQEKVIVDMLGIDESFYETEQYYDPILRQRIIQIRLNVDLEITFRLDGKYRTLELNKDEAILLWRAFHSQLLDITQQLDRNDFETIHTIKSIDQQYVQFIAKIKSREDI